nr:hypothetical protein ABT39_MTgene6138 [Picea glauca]
MGGVTMRELKRDATRFFLNRGGRRGSCDFQCHIYSSQANKTNLPSIKPFISPNHPLRFLQQLFSRVGKVR